MSIVAKREHELYGVWCQMKNRCYLPSVRGYEYYGGRGIKVCERWMRSFDAFVKDMGDRPTPQHSIDRIDNDGDYEPSNCRWATAAEQTRNYRRNVWLEHNGKRMVLSDWARLLGICHKVLWNRIFVQQWPVAKALDTPIDAKPCNTTWLIIDGERIALADAARKYGVKYTTVRERIRRGWSHEDAVKPVATQCHIHAGPDAGGTGGR